MSATESITPGELQQIVRAFADSDLRELRLSVGEVELLVSRNEHVDTGVAVGESAPVASGAAPAAATPAAQIAPAATETVAPAAPSPGGVPDGLVAVSSPAVGTFYRRPAPDKPPFVEVGSRVAVGDPVGTIEVMKMFTTVTAEVAGTVREICVDDATLVEHGQVLFHLDPAHLDPADS